MSRIGKLAGGTGPVMVLPQMELWLGRVRCADAMRFQPLRLLVTLC